MKFRILPMLLLCVGALATCNNQSSQADVTTPRNKAVPYIVVTSAQDIIDDPKVEASLTIMRNDSVLAKSTIGIELRGAISQNQDKKSYGFECRDAKQKSKKMSFLGLPPDEDWILYGPMSDPSLIRNAMAYSISNQIGRYAAHFRFVELEVNGDYKGLYLLMEKLKRNPARINIAKLEADDTDTALISGGYVIKLDKTAGASSDFSDYNEFNSFHSIYDEKGRVAKKSKIYYQYDYPKAKRINDAQKAYIQQYVADFERVMASSNYNDPENGYARYIDVASFVDYFILTEMMQNNDGYRISTFLQKDRHGKLAMGPIWDCDLAFGPEFVFCPGMRRDTWVFRYNQYCGGDEWLAPFWWEKLLKDDSFKAKVVARWKALRANVLSDVAVEKTISELAVYLQSHQLIDRNYERWSGKKKESYQERHQKHVNNIIVWYKKHAQWIDGEVVKL